MVVGSLDGSFNNLEFSWSTVDAGCGLFGSASLGISRDSALGSKTFLIVFVLFNDTWMTPVRAEEFGDTLPF